MYWFIQYSVTYCYICLYYNIIQHKITTAMPYDDIVACEISSQELAHGWTAFVLSRWEMRFDTFECVHHLCVPLHIIQYYNILYTKTQKHKHQNEKTFQVFNRIVQKNQAVRVRKRTVSCFQCSWRVVLTSGKMREITWIGLCY